MITAALLAAQQRIESLESSLRVYRGGKHPLALARIEQQLFDAYVEYDRLAAELQVKKEMIHG